MSGDLRELAALAALGALDAADARRLAEAAASDPALARELSLDRAVVEELDRLASRVVPPPDLGDRIVATALAGARPAAASAALHTRRRLRRFAPSAGVAVAAATIAVILTVLVSGRDDQPGPPVATATVEAHTSPTPISGTASLFGTDAPDGHVELDLAGVSPPPTGHHYTVWVLRKDAAAMEAIGTFASRDPSVKLTLRLPGAGDYGAVDISLQPDGGPPEHSGISVAGGTFTAGAG